MSVSHTQGFRHLALGPDAYCPSVKILFITTHAWQVTESTRRVVDKRFQTVELETSKSISSLNTVRPLSFFLCHLQRKMGYVGVTGWRRPVISFHDRSMIWILFEVSGRRRKALPSKASTNAFSSFSIPSRDVRVLRQWRGLTRLFSPFGLNIERAYCLRRLLSHSVQLSS